MEMEGTGLKDLYIGMGRLEGKVDLIISDLKETKELSQKSWSMEQGRLGKVERKIAYILGVGGALMFLMPFIIIFINHYWK